MLVVVAYAVTVASVWAVRVPFFEPGDELAHADYAFALYDAGRPFVARSPRPGQIVTPQERFLADRLGYRRMRYDPNARYLRGYGTRASHERIDASAPPPADRLPSPRSVMPYVAFSYPAGYYAIVATVMRAAFAISHSLTSAVLAGRLLGSVLLAVTLTLGYRLLRRYAISQTEAVLTTLAVGALPLTSIVAGTIQPDNLTFCLLTAGLLAARRWQQNGSAVNFVRLVAALGALYFVKQHYALALTAGVAVMLAGALIAAPRARRGAPALRAVALLGVAGICFAVSFYATPAGRLGATERFLATATPGADDVARIAGAFVSEVADAAVGKHGHRSYWFSFGFRGQTIFPAALTTALEGPMIVVTLASIVLFIAANVRIARRLLAIGARRRRTAIRLATAFVPATTYFVATVFVIGVDALSPGGLWLEGRYWLPVIYATFLMLVVVTPRIARGHERRRVRRSLVVASAVYSAIASVIALGAIDRSFFTPPSIRYPYAAAAGVRAVLRANGTVAHGVTTTVDPGEALQLNGFAMDGSTGLAARHIVCRVDEHLAIAATTGRPAHDLTSIYHDDAVDDAGFTVRLPRRELSPGRHRVACAIQQADGVRVPFAQTLTLDAVVGSGPT